jgi:hypothetical protein
MNPITVVSLQIENGSIENVSVYLFFDSEAADSKFADLVRKACEGRREIDDEEIDDATMDGCFEIDNIEIFIQTPEVHGSPVESV